jgi:hypothetical protein
MTLEAGTIPLSAFLFFAFGSLTILSLWSHLVLIRLIFVYVVHIGKLGLCSGIMEVCLVGFWKLYQSHYMCSVHMVIVHLLCIF